MVSYFTHLGQEHTMERFPEFVTDKDNLDSWLIRLEAAFRLHKVETDDDKVAWAHVLLSHSGSGFLDDLPPGITWVDFATRIKADLGDTVDADSLQLQFDSLRCSDYDFPRLLATIKKTSRKLFKGCPPETIQRNQIATFVRASPPQIREHLQLFKHKSLQDVFDSACLKAQSLGLSPNSPPAQVRLLDNEDIVLRGDDAGSNIKTTPPLKGTQIVTPQPPSDPSGHLIAAVMRHVEAEGERKEAQRKKEMEEEEKIKRQEEVYKALASLTLKVEGLYAGRRSERRTEEGQEKNRGSESECWTCGSRYHFRRSCPEARNERDPRRRTQSSWRRQPTLN